MYELLKRFAPAAVVLGIASGSPRGQDGVTIRYLANEGVLLSAGSNSVLIDGLFTAYQRYAVPPAVTQAALGAARPPFASVDLVFVTHRHGDHFHPAQVAAHLRANRRAVLVGAPQVIDSLRGRLAPAEIRSARIAARTIPNGERRHEVINGITVEILGVPHGGGRRNRSVQHHGYVVELGGRRVLHLGDTDLDARTYAKLRLDTARVDVALVPLWMITEPEGREIIVRWIRPKHVVAMHIPPEGADRYARDVRRAMPEAVALVAPGQMVRR